MRRRDTGRGRYDRVIRERVEAHLVLFPFYPSAVWELTAGPNGTFAHGGDDFLEIRERSGSLLLGRKMPIAGDDIWLG